MSHPNTEPPIANPGDSGEPFGLDKPEVANQRLLPFMIATWTTAEEASLKNEEASWPAVAKAMKRFPRMRYMGSKFRLLDWIYQTTSKVEFDSVLDAFSGSAAVGYMFKAAGKRVTTNDSLNFSCSLSRAVIANSRVTLSAGMVQQLRQSADEAPSFIRDTFSGIFFTPEDLTFLDRVWFNLGSIRDPSARALAISALVRASAKRQPRGVLRSREIQSATRMPDATCG